MNATQRYAQFLWLAPVAAVLVAVGILSRHPADDRFRADAIRLFEQAQRVEIYPTGDAESALTITRRDRRFLALLHGIRSSWVTARCPADGDTSVDIYLPPGEQEPALRRACYHTGCGQLTFAQAEIEPEGRALHMGPAFNYVCRVELRRALGAGSHWPAPSPCPKEFCEE